MLECIESKPLDNIDWNNVNICMYKKLLDNFFTNFHIDGDIIYCSNSHCDNITQY